MRIRYSLLIVFSLVSLIFSIGVIFASLHRTSQLLNKYFPGFFIYHTKVINSYDIPEWWEGRKSQIPTKAILTKLNDKEIRTPKDFWEEILKNTNREIEYKVEYVVDKERFIKFIKSQKFEMKDFIAFFFFWQTSGILILILGIIIYLGNRSKKGEMWLIASVLTGINFITTPSSSILSDIFLITFIERLTFSFFPVSMSWLFLNFPLRKFRKQTRIIIISIISSLGVSFFFISTLGYLEIEEVAKLQEIYYFYPGIGGIFAVISPIYDYLRTKRHNLYLFSQSLLPLLIGSIIFILIPSIFAIMTTFLYLPSYYVPMFVVGFPIMVILTVMSNVIPTLREISISLATILGISIIAGITYLLLFNIMPSHKPTIFILTTFFFILVSFRIFRFIRQNIKINTREINKEVINIIFDKLYRIDTISKFINLTNSELSKILGFAFSKFVSYKLIPKELRKTFFISKSYIFQKEDIENCCQESITPTLRKVIENSKYIITIKHKNRFFGIIALGKKITGDYLTNQELKSLQNISKILSIHINSIVDIILRKKGKKLLNQESHGISNIIVTSTLVPTYIEKDNVRLRTIIKEQLDKPTVFKAKEIKNEIFFCIVWIIPESVHTFILSSIIKGFIEEKFYSGKINIHRLPREIRNIISTSSPIEVDTNIICGVIKQSQKDMDVVNDGKTSIVLITKKNSIIPMPIHKRYFNFSKVKDGDRFLFITGEEIITQIQEIKEMDVRKLNPQRLFYDIPDKFILEISFHNIDNQ